ncbi:MAG: TetR/AcrR family transcriptional regulator [Flavobacteriaceae bacterium]|nr:TetR/AcrR family transcriptional regulator [Flavobacteriaceae bacterium]MDC1459627.1 TetR/AcrR family transcriptional regulator [Flavobacteriaceae bacterium]MDG1032005.1 TetR/AcrR family transcriptional regulator [Flavobacteriaceae bacterium]
MKQELKSKETQDLIINKSFELFYEKGYNATSIPDIMKETSLSKGAFYHHFKNKHEIGVKVIQVIIRKRIKEGFIAPLKNIEGNIPKLLLEVFTNRIKNYSEREKALGCPANNLVGEIGYTEQDFRVILKSLFEEWREQLINVIDIGKNRGEIKKNVNSSSVAISLICAFEGVRSIRKVYDDDIIFNEFLESMGNFIENLGI